jgi:hypothetical protein
MQRISFFLFTESLPANLTLSFVEPQKDSESPSLNLQIAPAMGGVGKIDELRSVERLRRQSENLILFSFHLEVRLGT